MKETINLILEIMYVICGVISILCGIYALRDQKNEKRIGSAAFWIIFGLVFILGPYINPVGYSWSFSSCYGINYSY